MAREGPPKGGLASLGLQNRLLEVAVVVGMDEDTGLHIRGNRDFDNLESTNLFDCHFKGHLLDILSGPQDSNTSSDSISSPWRLIKQTSRKQNQTRTGQNRPKGLQRGVSVRKLRKKANKYEEVPVSTDFLSNLPFLCLPEESKVFEKPPKSRIHCTVLIDIDADRHYATILTFYRRFHAAKNVTHSWTLETVLKTMKPEMVNGNDNASQLCYVPLCICLVSTKPYFSVLKDALSCFHKEWALSPSNSLRKILEKFVTNLSLVVCPPPTIRMRFSLCGLPIILSPPAHPSKPEDIIDIDLRLPLFVFMRQPTVLLNVLACIMHEQRIVFFSSDYTLLPLVMECFQCYIRPMEWHHQYIPILFSEIIAFVDCPGIFMMGCHSSHKEEIEKIENDLFLVDLDEARIYTNSHSSTETNSGVMGQFALHMPEFAVQNLMRRLTDFQLHNSITSVCQINPVTLEEIRDHSLEMRTKINRKIQNVFTEFMVDIFGCTLPYLDHERHQFKADKFLESIHPTDSPFYIKVSKSYMFRRFVRQRLSRITDNFSKVSEIRLRKRTSANASRPRIHSMEVPGSSDWTLTDGAGRNPTTDHRLNKELRSMQVRSVIDSSDHLLFSDDNLLSDHFANHDDESALTSPGTAKSDLFGRSTHTPSSEFTVSLPAFPVQETNFNARHFYRRCIAIITEWIDKVTIDSKTSMLPHCSSHRAGLLLLRGLYRLADDNLVNGLQDLHTTAKEDARFFPEKIIKKVVTSLNQHEMNLIQQHAIYKNIPTQNVALSRTQSVFTTQMRSFFSDDNTALYPLKKEPFSFVLEKSDVATDEKVISHLFQALCECSEISSREIDPECFNAFYQTWQQLKNECKKAHKSLSFDVRLPPEANVRRLSDISGTDQFLSFHSDERILKISAIVQSNKGNGRLVLTTRRVIFIGAGNQECKSVIRLEEILAVREGKLKNIFTSTVALFIIHQNSSTDSNTPLKIALKLHCPLWAQLINEIRSGRKLSHDQRDDNLVLNIAAQNVNLADAFFSAARDEGSMKFHDTMAWVGKLCKFESLRQSGELKSFSRETEEKMVMCMDLSPKESRKSGVCAITYFAAAIDETPHIWVGLASGKLRLVDTTTWSLDPKPIKDWDTKPNSLCLVKGIELWIGGDDSTIYVLCISTMKTTRILHDHSSPILSIVEAENDLVASATRSGEIIVWIHKPTKVHHKIKALPDSDELISFTPFKSYFCCCSTNYIVICDYEGNTLQRFEPGDSPTVLNSNLTCCTWEDDDDEIWAGDSNGSIYLWGVPPTERGVSSPSFLSLSKDSKVLRPKLSGVICNTGISCMTKHNGRLWAGNSNGEIIIFNTIEPRQECTLKAHDGSVTCLCPVENRYMISGSGDDDGKMVLWRQ